MIAPEIPNTLLTLHIIGLPVILLHGRFERGVVGLLLLLGPEFVPPVGHRHGVVLGRGAVACLGRVVGLGDLLHHLVLLLLLLLSHLHLPLLLLHSLDG